MSNFNKLVLTQEGLSLQSKLITGGSIKFTKVGIGDGELSQGQELSTLKDLVNKQATFNINDVKDLSYGNFQIRTVIHNRDILKGFYFREIGIYAEDEVNNEILYAVTNVKDYADFIPSKDVNLVSTVLKLNINIGNSENAIVNVEGTLAYATLDEIQALENKKTDKDYVDLELNKKVDNTSKGVANGVAELDETGKVPSSQLPSFVDDVLEYANLTVFPTAGEAGKIYVALDSNLTYRWSGTGYVEISPSIAVGETISTAFRGDRGKIAYDHSQDNTKHVTSAEKINWNGKMDKKIIDDATAKKYHLGIKNGLLYYREVL